MDHSSEQNTTDHGARREPQRTKSVQKSTQRQTSELREVVDWNDVPTFQTEDEEADFWGSHSFGPALLRQFRQQTDSPEIAAALPQRGRPVAVRFDAGTLTRLRRLAKKKNTGYQTLLKQFVVERLYEEEKREGLLP